jgi:hypothetical protein
LCKTPFIDDVTENMPFYVDAKWGNVPADVEDRIPSYTVSLV